MQQGLFLLPSVLRVSDFNFKGCCRYFKITSRGGRHFKIIKGVQNESPYLLYCGWFCECHLRCASYKYIPHELHGVKNSSCWPLLFFRI